MLQSLFESFCYKDKPGIFATLAFQQAMPSERKSSARLSAFDLDMGYVLPAMIVQETPSERKSSTCLASLPMPSISTAGYQL